MSAERFRDFRSDVCGPGDSSFTRAPRSLEKGRNRRIEWGSKGCVAEVAMEDKQHVIDSKVARVVAVVGH